MNTYYTIPLEKEIAAHSSILAGSNMISMLEYPKFNSQFKANKCMLDILRASGPGKTSLEFLDL